MPVFRNSLTVPFTPGQLFDLVADNEQYPEFLPFVQEVTVLQRDERRVVASVRAGIDAIRLRYTCTTTLERPGRIVIVSQDGPFRNLRHEWRFLPADERRTRVEYELQFELKSGLLTRLAGLVIGRQADSVMGAFVRRAEAVYGRPAPAAGLQG